MKSRRSRKRPDADICTQFGDAIRARRAELGLTQEVLAAKAGIHRTYIGDVERGARNVALRNVEKLAAALELSVPELFTRYRIGASPKPRADR